MSDDRGSSGLLTGLILGAGIGAGLTLLFGTDKGKKIRNQIRSEYPEVFDRLGEVEGEAQEVLADLRDHVSKTSPRRFHHSGHKL